MPFTYRQLDMLEKVVNGELTVCPFDMPERAKLLESLCDLGYAFKTPSGDGEADDHDDWTYRVTQKGLTFFMEGY